MRLITIGRSRSSTICIANDYVSANHAELVLLDNGDILLIDCNSRHGTFLFGKQIVPNVEVPVRRGDKIEFDQVPLDWSKVPSVPQPDMRVVKGIYGIGKNARNRYRISGDTVSRYHATFKEMKDGKWFIQDHSTNGTYVNGQRIPSNQDYKITHRDTIVCGNVPCPNPVPKPKISWQLLAGIGTAAAVVGLVWLLISIVPKSHKVDPAKTIALVTQTYRIKVVFDDDPVKDLFKVKKWYIDKSDLSLTDNVNQALERKHHGTAFFISSKGLMLTNKHVTDWVWADKYYNNGQTVNFLRNMVEECRNGTYELYVNLYGLTDEQKAAFDRWLKSPFKLEVETVSFGLRYPGRSYTSELEYDKAHLEAQSNDDKVDIAILRLNAMETPAYMDHFRMKDAVRDVKKLKMGSTNYYTIGFPSGKPDFTKADEDVPAKPTYGLLHLVQAPERTQLFMKGDESVGGQSGSPIYDNKNRLIGILWGGWNASESTGACPIANADGLLEQILEDESHEYKAAFR